MKLRKIVHSILNEADFKNIQSIIDGNQFVNGTANEESIIETNKYILFISPEGLKHIKERHSDRSKPGSIITGDLKDIITKTIQKSPSESSGGRVKWLDVKVGNVGEMGVAKATPEEVSGMADYTMPDGRKETVKIKQGQRPKTDIFNVITAEIGKDSGKPVLSIITAFPGPNSIDGVAMPMDRNEFAEKGFYFIVNKKLDENMKPSKEILRMKKLAGLTTESEIKQILKEELKDQIEDWMGWPTGKNWELIRDNFDDGLEALVKNFTKDNFAVSQITRMSGEIKDILDQKLSGMSSDMKPGIYARTLAPYIEKAMNLSK